MWRGRRSILHKHYKYKSPFQGKASSGVKRSCCTEKGNEEDKKPPLSLQFWHFCSHWNWVSHRVPMKGKVVGPIGYGEPTFAFIFVCPKINLCKHGIGEGVFFLRDCACSYFWGFAWGLRRCGRFGEREPVSIEKENRYLDASHQGVENLRFIFLRPPLSFESVFVELTLRFKY